MILEVNATSSELVESLVRYQHLTEGFELIGASPRLLYSLDVLGLGDRGAETVRRAELLDLLLVVNARVLARQREPIWPDPLDTEHLPLPVKFLESGVEHGEGLRGMNLSANKVTELYERTDGGYNLGRKVPNDRGQIHL